MKILKDQTTQADTRAVRIMKHTCGDPSRSRECSIWQIILYIYIHICIYIYYIIYIHILYILYIYYTYIYIYILFMYIYYIYFAYIYILYLYYIYIYIYIYINMFVYLSCLHLCTVKVWWSTWVLNQGGFLNLCT